MKTQALNTMTDAEVGVGANTSLVCGDPPLQYRLGVSQGPSSGPGWEFVLRCGLRNLATEDRGI
jgi:hypothetical protein